jgi:DNA (cytosine-5)-methyltransferase 1
MLRVIREVKPQWVVGENVRGLLNWNGGMVFHEVCVDLENIGYEVQAFIIPASGINAPHQRERLWVVANNINNRLQFTVNRKSKEEIFRKSKQETIKSNTISFESIKANGLRWNATHSNDTRTNNDMQFNGEWKENDKQRRGQSQSEHWENGGNGNAPNSDLHGFHERNGNNEINASERGINALNDIDQSNGIGDVADTESQRTWEQSSENRGWEDGRFNDISEDGNAPDTNGIGLWGKGDRIRESKFNGKNYARNNWQNFPTQSPVCSGDDGISHGLDNITFPKWRNESIKGYGNAVVPQVVYRIFKTIEYIQSLK